MAFSLSIYPWVYKAQFGQGGWTEAYEEKPHHTPAKEESLSPTELQDLLARRNSFPDLPLVNYTTQYGLGCFEGLKAYPQADGSIKLFRPDRNGSRMEKSMLGLMMPGYPQATYRFGRAGATVEGEGAVGFDLHVLEEIHVGGDVLAAQAVLRQREGEAVAGVGKWAVVFAAAVLAGVGLFVGRAAEGVVPAGRVGGDARQHPAHVAEE